MSIASAITAAAEIANVASKAINLSLKAIEASRIGDDAAADRFLAEARQQFSSALTEWDEAVAKRQAEDEN